MRFRPVFRCIKRRPDARNRSCYTLPTSAVQGYRCRSVSVPAERIRGEIVEHPPKVLVVDDDPAILEICSDLLQTEGYAVAVASNGQQALEQVGRERPAVVLMDIMMPVLDGVTACSRLKADPRTATIPVVLMSARTNLNRQNRDLAAADALVAKPFDIDHLLTTLHEMVNGSG